MTTELARWPALGGALLTVPSVKPSASTRSPTCAARPGIVVPFNTATVILSGATGVVGVFVAELPLFVADVEDEVLSSEPLTSLGTPTAAAAPSTSTPATASTT